MPAHFKHDILRYPGSYVYFSENDPDTAVVFVHGWGGDAVGTWLNFTSLLGRRNPSFWGKCDVYFFDYDGVNQHLEDSKNDLRQFVASVFPVPHEEVLQAKPPWLIRDPAAIVSLFVERKQEYKTLFLVGHSEGAVLIRMLVRDDIANLEKTPNWKAEVSAPQYRHLSAQLRLFAPATGGKSPGGMSGLLCGMAIFSTTLSYSRAHNDLNPPSDLLVALREHTEMFQQKYPAHTYPFFESLRAHVVFGTSEDIVMTSKYLQDIQHLSVDGKSHTTICKPKNDYLYPYRVRIRCRQNSSCVI